MHAPDATEIAVLNTVVEYQMVPPSARYEPDDLEARQVPVVSIFGAIDHVDDSNSQLSACLHVHGAFPYLLARPRQAGPDGSGGFVVDSVDWDDVASVRGAIPHLLEVLEEGLRGDVAMSKSSTKRIRRIAVVEGRGFYTYCAGPPAPFIRVEYYDPSHRWRIKRALELGLALSPEDALRFHCYEAHISSSMQFFKDYNLAGMAYVRVLNAVMRRPEGGGAPPVTIKGVAVGDDFVKETTCRIELDVSVNDILNVRGISQESQSEDMHLRAVPSLQEIWAQERRRMDKLVKPEDNFLATQHSTSLIPPQSGTRLARQGMKRLIASSLGLKENFDRVLKDILRRHRAQIVEANRRAQQGTMGGLTPSNDQAADALGALGGLFPSQDEASMHATQQSSNSVLLYNALQSEDRLQQLSQSYYNQQSTERRVTDHLEFTQRVDRGESIIDGPFAQLEDFIDPQTLAPYDDLDDEGDNGGGDSELSEEAVERDLRRLTQAVEASSQMKQPSARLELIIEDENKSHSSQSSVEDTELLRDTETVDDGHHDASPDPVVGFSADSNVENVSNNRMNSSMHHELLNRGGWVLPRAVPPSRGQVAADVEASGSVSPPSPGTSFLQAYVDHYDASEYRFPLPEVPAGGLYLTPVKLPPSRGVVRNWLAKQRKRNLSTSDNVRPKKQMKFSELGVEEVEWESQRPSLSLSQGYVDVGAANSTQVRSQSQSISVITASQKSALLTSEKQASADISSFDDTPTSKSSASLPLTAWHGVANQGGRLLFEGDGQLKATQLHRTRNQDKSGMQVRTSPLTIMSIEVHVQCRIGGSNVNSARFALTPSPDRDAILAIVYVFARDPGGGRSIELLERGCLFVPVEHEMKNTQHDAQMQAKAIERSLPVKILDRTAPFYCECVGSERQLFHRFASLVYLRDPDMLLSWDTQSAAGLGYIIERGSAVGSTHAANDGSSNSRGLDMARLLSRRRKQQKNEQSDPLVPSKDKGNEIEKPTSVNDNEMKKSWTGSGLGSEWDDRVGAGVAAASIKGRLVFAAWKIIAEEVKHPNVSYLPAVMNAVLGKRIPFHDDLVLNDFYSSNASRDRWRVVHYRLVHATSSLLLFDALDVIGRAGEASRLSCVEFAQSFPGIRGSQYKVEGVLLRALQSLNSKTHGVERVRQVEVTERESQLFSADSVSQAQSPGKVRRFAGHDKHGDATESAESSLESRSYFFFSPSLEDANNQEALEVQALTLEPESGHFDDPVIVCDFTALYPSLCIAYNLCYSTIAGRLDYQTMRGEMMLAGRTTGRIGPVTYDEARTASVIHHHMKSLQADRSGSDRAYMAPTGSVFVSESIVKGVLPQVLDEILTTRAMLKRAAKLYKSKVPGVSPAVLRQIEARQLALKYVANVTYGYTSATFSGRCAMPLLADTIVECGRRTLTNAINLANDWGRDPNGRWEGVKCVYGDTDSLFMVLPKRSVSDAFSFGEEFCAAVTAMNPPPVQLKLEKVYKGSMMQTKKKYCGMKFESKQQRTPVFEAKGIETIRRDQCALTQKVLRNALVTLFRDGVAAVRSYLFRQWNLILSGSLPVSEFILTGRVRSKYRGGRVGPVQAVLARRLAERDPSRVVRHKQRLAYVIVATPGTAFRLKDCVLTPMELLEQWDTYTIHTAYYVSRHVNPALQRCLGLAPYGIDVEAWFADCPKPRRRSHFWPISRSRGSIMISSFFGRDTCGLCGVRCRSDVHSRAAVCTACRRDEARAVSEALRRLSIVEQKSHDAAQKCSACNLCFEDGETFAVLEPAGRQNRPAIIRSETLRLPLANCGCIDCPVTYERHRLREASIEATAVVKALGDL